MVLQPHLPRVKPLAALMWPALMRPALTLPRVKVPDVATAIAVEAVAGAPTVRCARTAHLPTKAPC
jgi:hypothetical protein